MFESVTRLETNYSNYSLISRLSHILTKQTNLENVHITNMYELFNSV